MLPIGRLNGSLSEVEANSGEGPDVLGLEANLIA
jgi:hypothetical protein